MRVAFVLSSVSEPGGWRSHALGFLDAIGKYVSPILFVSAADRAYVQQTFPQWTTIELPATQLASTQRAGAFRLCRTYFETTLSKHRPLDLVQSLEAYPTGLIGHWLANRFCKPHIITAHGSYGLIAKGRLVDRWLYSTVLRNASALCPVSAGTGSLIRSHFPSAVQRTWIRPILNGSSYHIRIPAPTPRPRGQTPSPRLLSVGAIKRRKGYHVALKAFAQLRRSYPNATYHIVGRVHSPAYMAELRELIEANGIRGVRFLSQISEQDLRREYESASLFLLAPQQVGFRFEGFGLVYIEAGAFGLPVVGTRSGGVSDAVRDGETGLLADPSNVGQLAAAMERILVDKDLAARMGLAGRKWAETLTWERCATEQYSVYEQVLGGRLDRPKKRSA